MGYSSINTRRVDNRAALTETGDANHLVYAQTSRMNNLQRTSGIALASISGPAVTRIAGANHARCDTIWSFYGTVVPYRAR